MLRSEKEPRIERIKDVFTEHNFTILIDFAGSSVSAFDEFKTLVRGSNGEVLVAKNTLAKVALERIDDGAWCEDLKEYFVQSTALVHGGDDIGSTAKAVKKFKRSHDKGIEVKAILYNGQVYGPEKFQYFTELLSMDELKAKLVGILKAPQSKFVRLIKCVPQSFVGVIKSYIEKKGGEE